MLANTRDGQAFRGVLTGSYDDCVVLEHVTDISGDEETAIKGEVIVPRSNLSFIQLLGDSE